MPASKTFPALNFMLVSNIQFMVAAASRQSPLHSKPASEAKGDVSQLLHRRFRHFLR
jgi:hypothetical protein